jgi:hypothetical protein
MSMHITEEQLRTLVCEAFKYFDTLPNVFELWDTRLNGCYQTAILDFQDSFEPNIKRLMEESGPDDPNIRKLLTNYTYCCKWADIDPFDKYLLSEDLDIRVTYKPDYNYSPGSSGSYYEAPEPDEFDITEYNSKTVIKLLLDDLFGLDELHQEYQDNDVHFVIDTKKDGNKITVEVETIEDKQNEDKKNFEDWLKNIDDELFTEILDELRKDEELIDIESLYNSENYEEVINKVEAKAKEIIEKRIEALEDLLPY